ncbi:diguanylate cyclase (GGDEF)-like protein [Azospirillum agricola]|uniref:EAL domain-containing protein n=1 Tax=Azospirillum agricola TaxID=1720247 RepID=UPI001AE8D86F|nr:EAL domain-containing protein [Azospirillum agricola]MBP2227899.1 diguanylate cyclase (GGDEF)-like protein [Azospirillum agricola]
MARILVVDDHIVNREFLTVLLGYAGHEVLCAADGAEGLALTLAHGPELVISDVLMPGMGGVDFALALRADPRTTALPVIFYTTTYRLTEAYALAASCGVTMVLAKPSDPKTILATVARALGLDERRQPAVTMPGTAPAPGYLKELADLQGRMKEALDRGLAEYGETLDGPARGRRPDPAFEAVQGMSMRLFALLELALALPGESERPQLLRLFCRAAQDIMDCRYVVIGFLDREGRVIADWCNRGLSEEGAVRLASLDWRTSFLRGVLVDGERHRDRGRAGGPVTDVLPGVHGPANGILVIPVRSATTAPGLLYLADKVGGEGFGEEDEMFAVMLAAQLSLVHGGLAQHEEVRRHAAQLEIEVVERGRQGERLARLTRLYAVLSGINSLIVRTLDRDCLFREVCRIAVVEGGFRCAWVGTLDPATRAPRLVAQWGDMAEIDIAVRLPGGGADTPASRALREMRPFICNDCVNEPGLAPLRDALLAHGHLSKAVFPLLVGDRPVGVIAFAAGELNFFDEQEVQLLDELAGDISFCLECIEKEEKLNYVAFYDSLTGLPNLTLYLDRLDQLIQAARRDGRTLRVLVADLAGFTQLNSEAGRHVGDFVLKRTADRLGAALGDLGCVARCGSDMFAIAAFADGVGVADTLVETLLAAIERPLDLPDGSFHVTAQMGGALFPNDGGDAETLFKHAEAALGQAKASAQRFLYYAAEINERIARRRALESDLRTALEARQFVLHFQPRVSLANGHIEAAEALVRWRHPEKGLIPPGAFIPLAEETGLIVPLGAWVIDAACRQQAAWLREGLDVVPLAVNLSAAQLRRGQVERTLADALRRHGIDAALIECELTETALMQDSDEAARVLRRLREMGICLALDDFGTGYSSLAYLKRFPFDIVKIDRSFVNDVTRNADDAAIATTIIDMAHRLKRRVVAEGVETEAQLSYLHRQGCDEIQGYLFSRPVEAADFADQLRRNRTLALPKPEGADGQTLLLVDDEPNVLTALKRVLRRENYRILTAASGEEALRILALEPVQVIVSDQRMPGMSGAEFLGIARDLHPDTIRIILSGHTDLEAIMEAVNRGSVFKFLTKPCDDETLRRHVRDAFYRYRPVPESGMVTLA